MNHRSYAVVRISQGAASPTTVALTDVCSSLLDDCLSLNSRDNMTASIVRASSFLLWAWVNNHRAILCRDIWEGAGWQLHCFMCGETQFCIDHIRCLVTSVDAQRTRHTRFHAHQSSCLQHRTSPPFAVMISCCAGSLASSHAAHALGRTISHSNPALPRRRHVLWTPKQHQQQR